jgi:hypothetical protein
MDVNVRGLIVAAVMAVVGACGTLRAGDYAPPVYKKVVTYKTVEEQVVTKVPHQKKVVKYDHCGHPYHATETCYRGVIEVVCRKVPVVTWVKVCE